MICSNEDSCLNPKLVNMEEEFFCFNCYGSFTKKEEENEEPRRVNKYNCCESHDIQFGDLNDVCMNCGTIHQKIINELSYLENNEYETNVLHKSKKIHVPYQYLRLKFPEIKYTEIYDFIQNAIDFLKNHYNLMRRPYSKYTKFLYNFYRVNKKNIPELKHFNTKKDLILDKEVLDRLYELLDSKPNKNKISNIKSNNIIKKPTTNKEDLIKYYYFNKSKNQYFKKKRYCQFNKCFKIGNFKESDQLFCKEHTNNGININDKSIVSKCKYLNCKKTSKTDYCSNHKYKCLDSECNMRIMKNNSYCKNCK